MSDWSFFTGGLARYFSDIWRLFTSTPVPGTPLTCASLFGGLLVASVVFGFVGRLLGVGYRVYGSSRGAGESRKGGGK